jgi:two-component system response regulator NreC
VTQRHISPDWGTNRAQGLGPDATTAPIRVVVVDDHNVIRTGIRMLLAAHEGFDVVGEAASGEGVMQVLHGLQQPPDVVVMDLMMEGMGGIEATKSVRREFPETTIVILTMADDGRFLREAFAAGASGYVLKEALESELFDAVKAVADGGRYVHASVGELLTYERKRPPRTDRGVPLSKREVEVVRLIALGYSNKEIADELDISIRTVESHKVHIVQKTGMRARSEVTRFAIDSGIVGSQPA